MTEGSRADISVPQDRESASRGSGAASDVELVRQTRLGDPAAQTELACRLRCVSKFVHHLCQRSGEVTTEHDHDDMVGDVLSAVLEGLSSYRGDNVLEAWVFRITKFTLWRRFRNSRRRTKREVSEDVLQEMPAPPSAELALAQQQEGFLSLLDHLGGREADVVRLRILDGLDFHEISRQLQLPLATTRSYYYRAIQTVRRTMVDPSARA